MNLKAQIKRDINAHELMACHNLQAEIDAIDFVALSAIGSDDSEPAYTVANGVATIDVRGLLVPKTSSDYRSWGVTGYANLADYIQQANDDYRVTSIVLDIDSVGGYVAGLDGAVDAVHQSGKPIDVFVSGGMYSAAYWMSAGARKITAAKHSGIGSIGVLATHAEISKALDIEGKKVSIFKSGKWKAAFSSLVPLSAEEEARLQDGVNESASIFFNHVAAQRGLEPKTVKGWEGDTFTAAKAKELGLIDEIADSYSASTQTAQSNTNINPQSEETYVDELTKAQAKITELEADKAKAVQDAAEAKAAAAAAQEALAEAQATARQGAIDKLATDTGRTFNDEQVTAFKAMDQAQFDTVASLMQPAAPKLPDGLDKPQATNGREASESKIMAAVNELNKGAK